MKRRSEFYAASWTLDLEAELLQAPEKVFGLAFPVMDLEVVRSEVLVVDAPAEDVPDRHQDRMLDDDYRLLRPSAGPMPVVQAPVVAIFRVRAAAHATCESASRSQLLPFPVRPCLRFPALS